MQDIVNHKAIKFLHKKFMIKNNHWFNTTTCKNRNIVEYLHKTVKLNDRAFKNKECINDLITGQYDSVILYLLENIEFVSEDFIGIQYYENIHLLKYVHLNNFFDIKSIDDIFNNTNLNIIKYLHTEVCFTKTDFKKNDNAIIRYICNNDNDMLKEQVEYLHQEINFGTEEFTHLIAYLLDMINRNDNDINEYYTNIYLYCTEFFDIDRENINILNEHKILSCNDFVCDNNQRLFSEQYSCCDICFSNISSHDYKYSPKCCRKFNRNICKDCGYKAIGIMDAKCLSCRKEL